MGLLQEKSFQDHCTRSIAEIARRLNLMGLNQEDFEERHDVHFPSDNPTIYPILRSLSPNYAGSKEVGFLEEDHVRIVYHTGDYVGIEAALETRDYLRQRNVRVVEEGKDDALKQLRNVIERSGRLVSRLELP